MSKNSQFYEINICQVMIFRLYIDYNEHDMIKIGKIARKIASIIESARIILLPTVRVSQELEVRLPYLFIFYLFIYLFKECYIIVPVCKENIWDGHTMLVLWLLLFILIINYYYFNYHHHFGWSIIRWKYLLIKNNWYILTI